ncbi:uncharacterized protein [Nicotiana sylvestris]|uniref:uncharacterized protein n=1 Tax=Nicotiana sylvestris TaxID=4096 RepID=UPI00388CEC84
MAAVLCSLPGEHGHSSLSALPAQSSSGAPSVQCSSMAGSSTSYPGSRGSLQSLPPIPGSCFKCEEFGHMWRQCPHRQGGAAQQRVQAASSAPVTSPLSQSAWGGAQSVRGRPRGGGQSGRGHARFYALPVRPDAIASDTVITRIVLVCH